MHIVLRYFELLLLLINGLMLYVGFAIGDDNLIEASSIICAEIYALYNLVSFILRCMRRQYKHALFNGLSFAVLILSLYMVARVDADKYLEKVNNDSQLLNDYCEGLKLK